MKKSKKNTSWGSLLWMCLLFAIGALCGFFAIQWVDLSFLTSLSPRMQFLGFVFLFALIYLAYLLQVILHETGHLLVGLACGYRFSSFRIGKLMLLRRNGRMQWARFSLAGTGGQCLLIPPKPKDGRIPMVGFLLGGSALNLLAGGAALTLAYLLREYAFAMIFFGAFGLIGIFSALLNGIPLRTKMIANDGANALEMKRDARAALEFARHLEINAQSVEGVRLREMPEGWFEMPSVAELRSNAYAERAVFRCNRLMDEGRFEAAEEAIRHLSDAESAMAGVHRKLLICDQIFCELVGECRTEVLGELYTREQYSFMRSMKDYPSVIRTEYAYALLYQHDGSKARMLRDAFEKCAKSYPNVGEICTERELLACADRIRSERK